MRGFFSFYGLAVDACSAGLRESRKDDDVREESSRMCVLNMRWKMGYVALVYLYMAVVYGMEREILCARARL